ncbi:hypothetical protein [Acinetobacter seifertii]|uniref:hypothetical protein n=1 Tax=Acinetobacter seifertii TaxID=1530123 RepID=UPI000C21C9BE|nr:hypothetical protein [Acinetobacter seifertii]PJG64930.1 hypothetical protein CVD09_19025 [Acinetobacter seifertii]
MIKNKFMKFLLFITFAVVGSAFSYLIYNIIPLITLLVIYGLIVKDPALRAHKFLEREVYFVPCNPSTTYKYAPFAPPFFTSVK